MEKQVEKLLTVLMHKVVEGIPNGQGGFLEQPVESEAKFFLDQANQVQDAAVAAAARKLLVAESTWTKSFWTNTLVTIVGVIPLVGGPTACFYPQFEHLFKNLRFIAVSAAIYGQDVRSEAVQCQILLCLVHEKIQNGKMPSTIDGLHQGSRIAATAIVRRLAVSGSSRAVLGGALGGLLGGVVPGVVGAVYNSVFGLRSNEQERAKGAHELLLRVQEYFKTQENKTLLPLQVFLFLWILPNLLKQLSNLDRIFYKVLSSVFTMELNLLSRYSIHSLFLLLIMGLIYLCWSFATKLASKQPWLVSTIVLFVRAYLHFASAQSVSSSFMLFIDKKDLYVGHKTFVGAMSIASRHIGDLKPYVPYVHASLLVWILYNIGLAIQAYSVQIGLMSVVSNFLNEAVLLIWDESSMGNIAQGVLDGSQQLQPWLPFGGSSSVGDASTSTFMSFEASRFNDVLDVMSTLAMHCLMDEVRRPEILVKLLGPRNVVDGLIFAARRLGTMVANPKKILDWLDATAPSPTVCCLLIAGGMAGLPLGLIWGVVSYLQWARFSEMLLTSYAVLASLTALLWQTPLSPPLDHKTWSEALTTRHRLLYLIPDLQPLVLKKLYYAVEFFESYEAAIYHTSLSIGSSKEWMFSVWNRSKSWVTGQPIPGEEVDEMDLLSTDVGSTTTTNSGKRNSLSQKKGKTYELVEHDDVISGSVKDAQKDSIWGEEGKQDGGHEDERVLTRWARLGGSLVVDQWRWWTTTKAKKNTLTSCNMNTLTTTAKIGEEEDEPTTSITKVTNGTTDDINTGVEESPLHLVQQEEPKAISSWTDIFTGLFSRTNNHHGSSSTATTLTTATTTCTTSTITTSNITSNENKHNTSDTNIQDGKNCTEGHVETREHIQLSIREKEQVVVEPRVGWVSYALQKISSCQEPSETSVVTQAATTTISTTNDSQKEKMVDKARTTLGVKNDTEVVADLTWFLYSGGKLTRQRQEKRKREGATTLKEEVSSDEGEVVLVSLLLPPYRSNRKRRKVSWLSWWKRKRDPDTEIVLQEEQHLGGTTTPQNSNCNTSLLPSKRSGHSDSCEIDDRKKKNLFSPHRVVILADLSWFEWLGGVMKKDGVIDLDTSIYTSSSKYHSRKTSAWSPETIAQLTRLEEEGTQEYHVKQEQMGTRMHETTNVVNKEKTVTRTGGGVLAWVLGSSSASTTIQSQLQIRDTNKSNPISSTGDLQPVATSAGITTIDPTTASTDTAACTEIQNSLSSVDLTWFIWAGGKLAIVPTNTITQVEVVEDKKERKAMQIIDISSISTMNTVRSVLFSGSNPNFKSSTTHRCSESNNHVADLTWFLWAGGKLQEVSTSTQQQRMEEEMKKNVVKTTSNNNNAGVVECLEIHGKPNLEENDINSDDARKPNCWNDDTSSTQMADLKMFVWLGGKLACSNISSTDTNCNAPHQLVTSLWFQTPRVGTHSVACAKTTKSNNSNPNMVADVKYFEYLGGIILKEHPLTTLLLPTVCQDTSLGSFQDTTIKSSWWYRKLLSPFLSSTPSIPT